MHLYKYLDVFKLQRHICDGLIEVNHHKTLPLHILTYTRKTVYDCLWDDVTTKCRGLIIGHNNIIISRPFEKFFNINTTYRPETNLFALPARLPIVTEKLDGSLGILWKFPEMFQWAFGEGGQPVKVNDSCIGIATKGSFHSKHAEWATQHYLNNYKSAVWPKGYTPLFEIINEQIQHHIVHYGCPAKLVLIGMINNETGEEADYNTCYHWAKINGIELISVYGKTTLEVLNENRENHEGYVLSWSNPCAPPLKIKVKHNSFLIMQSIIHKATPKAILEALREQNYEQIETWTSNFASPLTDWINDWITKFSLTANDVSHKAYQLVLSIGATAKTRKEFAETVLEREPEFASICFAMLDQKDHRKQMWKVVEKKFADDMSKPFTTSDEVEEELE